MNNEDILEEMQDIINDLYYSNAVIGCLCTTNEEEIIYQDLKDSLFNLNINFKKLEKRLNNLFKPVGQLIHKESD